MSTALAAGFVILELMKHLCAALGGLCMQGVGVLCLLGVGGLVQYKGVVALRALWLLLLCTLGSL